jgi:hypothetical protein
MAKRKSKVGRKKINPMDKKEQVSFYTQRKNILRHGGKDAATEKAKRSLEDNID